MWQDIFLKQVSGLPEEYIYTKQTVGIDAQQKSNLTGFLTADDLAKTLDTPAWKSGICNLNWCNRRQLRSIYESETSKLEVRNCWKNLEDKTQIAVVAVFNLNDVSSWYNEEKEKRWLNALIGVSDNGHCWICPRTQK